MKLRRAALLFGAVAGLGCAGAVLAQSIYTCVDARGRRLTSDRPIAECLDRTQHELNPSGSVRRELGPSLTAAERAEREARERQQAQQQARQQDALRRDRALLARYRDQAAHDRAREQALSHVEAAATAVQLRLAELDKERAALDRELEFYPGRPPEQLPAKLRQQLADHEARVATQRRFLDEQAAERRRINERYDEELARLRELWAQPAR